MSDAEHVVLADDSNFAKKVSHGVSLVDFYADWCGPCRMMKPIFEKVSSDNSSEVHMYTMN